MTTAFKPADSTAATRSSTFSLREAAISTSISSGDEGAGPIDLEVEVDFFEREGDVLIGFGFDLKLKFILPAGRP